MANGKETVRKIIHVDMDAFYAAVEQRDHPAYRGKPVIVGGDPNKRGVVSTCSYEARRFGVHSAMPTRQAYKLCPQGIFIPPEFSKYQAVSCQVQAIFLRYTPIIEPLSLDEAYLDLTEAAGSPGQVVALARQILYEILGETHLTASAGVSYNKFLAKAASDYHKPFGLTVVTPSRAQAFIDALPIRRFYGVGPATEKVMNQLGIHTGADLRLQPREVLIQHFGKSGDYFYQISRGIDDRPVCCHHERKSLSVEETFERDLVNMDQIRHGLSRLVRRLWLQMKDIETTGRRVILKVRYEDFSTVTRSKSIDDPVENESRLLHLGLHLLHQTEAGLRQVRLLGIGLGDLKRLK
jgi:DNA polymerase-4